MSYTIGIDLGTTNSAMAVLEAGQGAIVANAEGSRTTPSVVAFTKKGELVVGDVALRQAVTNPKRTIASAKRHIGTDWKTDDIDGKKYSAEEIGARVLMKLKKDAETFLGGEVDAAVITVPAYFNDSERQATKAAGEIAGLKVERIINEPTAAALAYGLDKESDQVILVYDLGGGTFDVSLLEIGEGYIEVRSTAGDNRLGGDDWDNALIKWITDKFKADTGVDVTGDIAAMTRVKEVAENVKKELSAREDTSISIPYLSIDPSDNTPLMFEGEMTRAEFENLTHDLLERTRQPVQQVLDDAGVTIEQINQVLLVGGSTRMPAVTALVKELTGKEPNKTVNPDEVVAMGAAIQGGIKTGEVKEMVLIDVTSLTLGLSARGGVMVPLIPRGTAMPCRRAETFTTAEDGQTSVQVEVYQGERQMVSGNKKLGQFDLMGIPPAPRGVPQIEVTFDIDVNGILTVSAKDKASGVAQRVTVTGSSGMDKNEIDRAVRDAESNAEEDQRLREQVAIKNRAESLVYQNERMLKEYKDRVPADVASNLESSITRLKGKLENSSMEELKKDSDDLFEQSQRFGAAMYGDSGSSYAPPPPPPTPPAAETNAEPAPEAAEATEAAPAEGEAPAEEAKPE